MSTPFKGTKAALSSPLEMSLCRHWVAVSKENLMKLSKGRTIKSSSMFIDDEYCNNSDTRGKQGTSARGQQGTSGGVTTFDYMMIVIHVGTFKIEAKQDVNK